MELAAKENTLQTNFIVFKILTNIKFDASNKLKKDRRVNESLFLQKMQVTSFWKIQQSAD